jgi:chromosome partitioning protein
MMGKVFAIASQKGGVGKTTTTGALAAAFAEHAADAGADTRILVVDGDPQAGLTVSFGFDPDRFEQTIYQALIEEVDLAQVVIPTKLAGVDLAPANLDLAGAEAELIGQIGWDRTLKDALEPIRPRYDHIFIDCPPTLGVLTTNALVAAQTAIVPLQCEYLALRALKQLDKVIATVKKKANPSLEVRLLRTMYDRRTLHAQEVVEEIARVGGERVFRVMIHRTVKFADSTVAGEPILVYAKDSEAAQAYRELAKEIALL